MSEPRMYDCRGLHPLRKPCVCGHEIGRITHANGQDVVRCAKCGKWQYNAPKTETGRKGRSLQTTHKAIKPKQRYRILSMAGGKCMLCGKRDCELHVDHAISVKDGHAAGLTDEVINSDDNLMALCAECNLGKGDGTLPLNILIAALRSRATKRNQGIE